MKGKRENGHKRDCKVYFDKTEKVPGKRKRVKKTRCWCKVCLLPLCLEPCFELFHTCVNCKDNELEISTSDC